MRTINLSLLCATTLAMFVSLIVSVTTQAAPYKETTVANGGSVKGKLTFDGLLPADAIDKVAITKNPDVCGEGYREIIWIDVKEGGALTGAFVFLDKVKEGKAWPAPQGGNYMIEQKNCRFTPWAQVVKRGDIVIRNSDEGVLHNINTRELINVEKGRVVKKTMFNFGQPKVGDINKKIKPRRSSYIAMNCEAHNFMFGFMLAPEHPYATVVNADGTYSIDGIPPGSYTLKAWHPSLGVQKSKITIAAGASSEANFTFSKK